MPRAKHHYVPRFYLRGFADQKGRLRTYDRCTRCTFPNNVEKVVRETEFYTVLTTGGEPSEVVEEFLSRLEDKAAIALKKHDLRAGVITAEDRMTIAMLIALQHVRTPIARKLMQDIVDSHIRMDFELNVAGSTPEQVRNYIKQRSNIENPDDDMV